MFSDSLTTFFLLCFGLAAGNSLQPSRDPPLIDLANNLSVNARTTIECDGAKYGHNPDTIDCRKALTQIPSVHYKVTFLDRASDPHPRQYLMPLPFRVMGGKSSLLAYYVLLQG